MDRPTRASLEGADVGCRFQAAGGDDGKADSIGDLPRKLQIDASFSTVARPPASARSRLTIIDRASAGSSCTRIDIFTR